MKTDEVLDLAEKLVREWTVERSGPQSGRLDLRLGKPEDLIPAVAALRVQRLGYLSAITGIDLGSESDGMEALYHFCTGEAVVTLRIRLPREAASLPSLCELIPSAGPFERELREMFGITIVGLPDADKLYLPDDWSEHSYPLRKDWDPLLPTGSTGEGGG